MTKNQKEASEFSSSARQRFILMSARKMRHASALARGLSYIDAVNKLRFSGLRASGVILKKLTEAAANAREKYNIAPEQLMVRAIMVDEGPTHRRFKARAQGRMYKILKRTSHLTVQLGLK